MNIDEALNCDVIQETEKIYNKSWKEFDKLEQSVCLLNAIRLNEEKRECFKNASDTYHSMKWKDLKELLFLNGFKEAFKYKFDNNKEEAIILYKKEKGLIIFAESYFNMDVVNSGHLYGEIKAKNKESCKDIMRYISTGGCIDQKKLIFETQHDIREGLFTKLTLLEYYGNFLPYWINKNRFLWFLDYTETKKSNYDFEKITREKINKCPQDFKDIIFKETK